MFITSSLLAPTPELLKPCRASATLSRLAFRPAARRTRVVVHASRTASLPKELDPSNKAWWKDWDLKAEPCVVPASTPGWTATWYRKSKRTPRVFGPALKSFELECLYFDAMFGQDVQEVLVDLRCELDGQMLPLDKQAPMFAPSGCVTTRLAKAKQGTRTFVNIEKSSMRFGELLGRTHLGWRLERPPAGADSSILPRLVVVLRTTPAALKQDIPVRDVPIQVSDMTDEATGAVKGKAARDPGAKPQDANRVSCGVTMPMKVFTELFDASGGQRTADGYWKKELNAKLTGAVPTQGTEYYQATVVVPRRAKDGKLLDRPCAIYVSGLEPKKNGLAGKRVIGWRLFYGKKASGEYLELEVAEGANSSA